MRSMLFRKLACIILCLSFSATAFADPDEVFKKTVEACLSVSDGLEFCQNLRTINQQISELGTKTAKQLGLDGTAGALVATSTQALVERRVRFNTVIQGANGNLQISPEAVALGLNWTF
jgi:hypothetical protein